jgi:hypothetical protein
MLVEDVAVAPDVQLEAENREWLGLALAELPLEQRMVMEFSYLMGHSWWQEILKEPDPKQRLTLYAKNARQIHQRTTDIFVMVRSAAEVEPAMAELRRELGESHYQDDSKLVESLAIEGALAPGVTKKQATDLLWGLGSADLYRIFVVDCGWLPEQYEQWLAMAWIHNILEGRGV